MKFIPCISLSALHEFFKINIYFLFSFILNYADLNNLCSSNCYLLLYNYFFSLPKTKVFLHISLSHLCLIYFFCFIFILVDKVFISSESKKIFIEKFMRAVGCVECNLQRVENKIRTIIRKQFYLHNVQAMLRLPVYK